MTDAWILQFANSPWVYPALFLLVVGDAFFVVLPSETAVVALAALAGATGSPMLGLLVPVAALGAIIGDSACYWIGRSAGHDRWKWQRRGRLGRALGRARATVLARPAVLIFTARYIPFARIAVNLSAGAAGLPYRRFLPLSVAAGTGWAIYNTAVGLIFGSLMSSTPVLAIVVSVVVAVSLGLLIDRVADRLSMRRIASASPEQESAQVPPAPG